MKHNINEISDIFKQSYSYNDFCKKYFGYVNSKTLTKARNLAFNNAIDTSHFNSKKYTTKYEIIVKTCPVCQKQFNARKGHKKEKETCSYKCSNTHFRSGNDNGGYKETKDLTGQKKYVRICFETHIKKCVICNETNIVCVHHYDNNHNNNNPENLVPMCPTHHQYMHSKFISLIKNKVDEYVAKWKQEHQL